MDIAGPNSLIRLLRSPQDPSQQNGLSKIAIAQRVWSTSADIPGKADIIRDWIYSVWEKDGKGSATKVLFDIEQLDLLRSILASTSQALPPHILSLYLRARSSTTSPQDLTTHKVWEEGLRHCTASTDTWVELWVEMMKYLGRDGAYLDLGLVRAVEDKVSESIALVPISKKSSLAVHHSLSDISKAFAQHADLDCNTLGSIIYPASSLKLSKAVLSCLEALPLTSATLQFIPRLLCALESSARNQRYDVFIQPTSSKTPYQTYTNERVRSFLCTAIRETQAHLSSVSPRPADLALWRCRRDIWRNVTSWGVYVESDQSWRDLLVNDVKMAKGLLRGHPDAEIVGVLLSLLNIAEGLDHTATNIEVDTMAWCLATPLLNKAEAEDILSATCRYHRLSQSPEIWVALVVTSVEQLLISLGSPEARLSLHQAIVEGPLFSDAIWQQLSSIRKTDQIVKLLLSRLDTMTRLDTSTAIVLDIISYLAIALCAEEAITSVIDTIEALLLPIKPKRRDSAFDLSLAALVRLGRRSSPEIRAKLGSDYDLAGAASATSSTELRAEACLWLIARIGDTPDQAQDLIKSLVVATQHKMAHFCWDALDREGLSALEYSATTEQLEKLFIPRSGSELHWLLSSAEMMEMPRVLNAILRATLHWLSNGQPSGRMFELLASLPPLVLDDAMRQAILDHAQTADAHADDETSCAIRRALAYLIRGSTVKVDITYWAILQRDTDKVTPAALRAWTRRLLKAFIEVALDSENELDRLLDRLSYETSRTLAAEVALEHDAARVSAKVKSRFRRMVDEMRKGQTEATSAHTLLKIRELGQWTDDEVPPTSLPPQLATYRNLGPAELELIRLECDDGPSQLGYLHLLMSKSHMIPQDTLRKEVVAIAAQTSDLGEIIRVCLARLFTQSDRADGFAVLTELLSIRRQGSGKAILGCREMLLDCLLRVPPFGSVGSAQLCAIRTFVRLRSKLLRVADISRIMSTLSCCPNTMAIDIVHAAVLTRGDLVTHVLPILARFLCNAFDSLQEVSAISLSRLLSTFGSRRSAKSTRDAPLSVPFSKHAPAILVAYVRSVTRTHNPLSIATRRSLQMSVYTICDSVIRAQDRGREGEGIGIPYGLGETGEAEQEIWADLWKQWAKQRYRGQG